jgi:predicted nucleic acid-binding protein
MLTIPDETIWLPFLRRRTPPDQKRVVLPHLLALSARLAKPIAFALLRHATPAEAEQIEARFATMPLLATPPNLWTLAAKLGQECRRRKIAIGEHKLLVAAIAICHDAEIVTFDEDYSTLGAFSTLRVRAVHEHSRLLRNAPASEQTDRTNVPFASSPCSRLDF